MFGVLASGKLVSFYLFLHSLGPYSLHLHTSPSCIVLLLSFHYVFQVNTNVQQAGPDTFLLAVDGAESINHIVVFLTGQVPFSNGFGGSIYLGWPSTTAVGGQASLNLDGVSWQLLGFISNEKPSAIFKIAKVKPHEVVANPFGGSMAMDMSTATGNSLSLASALVGVSVEPLSEIAQKTPSADTAASTVDSFTEFSQKMLENFFNYAGSFAASPAQIAMQQQMGNQTSESYIPFSALQQWYLNFQRRLQSNPDFWKSL